MGILFRYILREVIFASAVGTALFTFVLYLQFVGPLMTLLVRPSSSLEDVGYLFLLVVPQTFRFTFPMGVLLGVLVGLGRLSTDSEITALRAAGVPSLRCAPPILLIALAGAVGCAWSTLHLNPAAQRELERIRETLTISQATAEVPPRVFVESFPNFVLYVSDVAADATIRWKGVFLADMRSPQERGSFDGVDAAVDGPRITLAEEAIVVPLPDQNRLQLRLPHAATYEQSFDPTQYHRFEYEQLDQPLESPPSNLASRRRPFDQMSTADLTREARQGENRLAAGIELHQRFAFPIACLVLPMVGIPLAISSRRSGKSVGVVFSVILVFSYWMIMTGGIALAKEEVIPVIPAIWAANVIFALAGGLLLAQLDSPHRRDIAALVLGRTREWAAKIWGGAFGRFEDSNGNGRNVDTSSRPGVRQVPSTGYAGASGFRLIDRYVLQTFLLYFAVLAGVFIVIWFVFSFFELLNDMLARDKLGLFIPYIFYLTPFLIYQTAPLSVMVATLVSFGILAKHQELVAFRACGVSLYRLAAPILVASLLISAGLFALDYRYLPETNRKQDAIRDEIKGRPVRSFLRPGRQWTFGRNSRIFYHRFFDPQQQVLAGLNVYDLDPETFRLRRHIAAERARWDVEQRAWVMENGWEREINGDQVTHFEQFPSKAFPDLSEDPAYFQKEERQHQQMNWTELRSYIMDLTQSGFDTVRLQVQLQRKLAFPMFGITMALLAVPFSFIAGPRGALTGVAMSIGLAIAYYSVNSLFEQLGMASQLTPLMAAWAPTAIFGLSGAYLFLKVRS